MSPTDAIGVTFVIFAAGVLVFVIGPVTIDAVRRRVNARREPIDTPRQPVQVRRFMHPMWAEVPASTIPTSPLDRRIAELEHDEHERVIEQRIRNRIADQLHDQRHRRALHQGDTWFTGIVHAERIVRGEN